MLFFIIRSLCTCAKIKTMNDIFQNQECDFWLGGGGGGGGGWDGKRKCTRTLGTSVVWLYVGLHEVSHETTWLAC